MEFCSDVFLLPHGGVPQVAGIDLESDLYLRGDYPLASDSAFFTGCVCQLRTLTYINSSLRRCKLK